MDLKNTIAEKIPLYITIRLVLFLCLQAERI